MVNPTGGESFSVAMLWNLLALIAAMVMAIVVATYKILKVLRAEIRTEISPIMGRIDEMEKRFIDAVRAIWEDQTSQDARIEAITASHNRLQGAHDAIVLIEGHGGTGRRKTLREPGRHCSDQE